ncbi:hypothetical protein AX774_g7443 [Zancudomyces culisetae]|uniref:Uncharacterized protein n=1 Tax=Zancudomyces culisetae TaxID=1213189 RepID=A0A1R1PDV4_ZANCU|nr:hypothetical protein AX774_g7443 [Zancudomyces culisetae]|eukprot:OMH79157.1 hypothetical protein AX774_g7443 [Zancudomyces culisetae]
MGLVSSVAVITVTDATEHSELNASPLNPNEPILVKSSNASSFEVQFFRPIQLGYTLRVIVYVYFFVSIYSGNSEAASK